MKGVIVPLSRISNLISNLKSALDNYAQIFTKEQCMENFGKAYFAEIEAQVKCVVQEALSEDEKNRLSALTAEFEEIKKEMMN